MALNNNRNSQNYKEIIENENDKGTNLLEWPEKVRGMHK